MNKMQEIIKLEKVTKEYQNGSNKIIAVNNITVNFHKGESIAISGISGCGKSTLIHLIGLIKPPTLGNIYINKRAVTDLSNNERAYIRNGFYGYISQNYLLIDGYTVANNVEIPLIYAKKKLSQRQRTARVMEILAKVGLSDKAKTDVKNLSGGQQQRVAIARALVNQPDVILADEPTGALDSNTGKEIMDIILNLVKEGKTLIMVTHNTELASKCKTQLTMKDGCILSSVSKPMSYF
ncbi:MAG: ABC transporter ATP-binding protein [Clostridiales bacterium]|nr:ABC transporter ATP-binding protein [Clostridiales bacterium]